MPAKCGADVENALTCKSNNHSKVQLTAFFVYLNKQYFCSTPTRGQSFTSCIVRRHKLPLLELCLERGGGKKEKEKKRGGKRRKKKKRRKISFKPPLPQLVFQMIFMWIQLPCNKVLILQQNSTTWAVAFSSLTIDGAF